MKRRAWTRTGAGGGGGFNPATPFNLYLDGADYDGAGTWTAQKGTNATSIGVDPTTGATLGGINTVDFDGTQYLRVLGSILNWVSTSSWFAMALFKARTIGADSASPEANNTIVQESSGQNFGIELRATGPTAYGYQYGSGSGRANQTIATGTWELFLAKYDGSDLYSALGSSGWSAGDALSGAAIGANPAWIGRGGAYFDGQLAALGLAKTIPSDGDITSLIAAIDARWGTSF